MPGLSVIVPLYNEERRIALGVAGVEKLRSLVAQDIEVIWVDDGSSDQTVHKARTLVSAGDRVLEEPHRGKGGALRAGVQAATGDRLLLTDVDWSVSPEQIPAMLARTADVVIASREHANARRIGEAPWRHWMGRAFNRATLVMVGLPYADTQCGCKLLSRAVAQAAFDQLTIVGWAWDVEVLAIAVHRGASIDEFAVEWSFADDSRVRPLRDGLAMSRELWRIRRNLRAGHYRAC